MVRLLFGLDDGFVAFIPSADDVVSDVKNFDLDVPDILRIEGAL